MERREWFMESGQRWRSPDGDEVSIGTPEIPDGWWVRHSDGREEVVADDELFGMLRRWELVASLEPGQWAARPGLGRFYDR